MTEAILCAIVIAEFFVILALINRLLESAGKRQIRPVQQAAEAIRSAMPAKEADTEKVERDPGVKVGSYKIRL